MLISNKSYGLNFITLHLTEDLKSDPNSLKWPDQNQTGNPFQIIIQIIIQKLVERNHEVTVMRSAAYTDFIKNDMPSVNLFDFHVPYAPGMHLQSMDKVLWASKLGAAEDMSKLGTAYSMVNFWYEQGKF